MELVEVEAVEDRSRAEGGHAVILLRGVDGVPSSVRFRLRPIDAEGLLPQVQQFLEQTHDPLSAEATDDGVALMIGPGLADHPGLVPGTAVEITLVDAGWRGEFLWPAVTPLARPKRRSIMTRRTIADAPLPDLAPQSPGASPPTTVLEPAPDAIPRSVMPLETSHEPTPRRSIILTSDQPKSSPTTASLTPEISRAASTPLPATDTLAPHRESMLPVAAEPALEWSRVPGAVPAKTKVDIEASAHEANPPLPLAPVVPKQVTTPPAPQAVQAQEQGQTSAPRTARQWSAGSAAAMAIALMIGGQFILLKALDIRLEKRGQTIASAPARALAPAPQGPVAMPQLPQTVGGVYDVLAAGPVSPRGVSAAGVSPARALQLAHTLLHGPEMGRDREEAIYWLKRYVLAASGTEHARIALTQLGSAYAQPADGKRDLASAMVAWELAGAMGDGVAMCFLAAMHAQGIGVPPDQAKADAWHRRAVTGGGSCASPGAAPP